MASDPVSITVTADRTALPLNISGVGYNCASDGSLGSTPYAAVGSPYMTTLYIQAKTESGKVLTGSSLFQFNILSGFESGELYYLDGKHETGTVTCRNQDGTAVTNTTAGAYRFGTLDASANGSTMHLLSTDKVGSIVVQYAVVDPQTNKLVSKTVTVNVGGGSTAQPLQLKLDRTAPNYLYVQGLNGPTNLTIQASLRDESGQLVSDPAAGTHNVVASIVSQPVPGDARLAGTDGSSGLWIYARTINGQATFSVSSGSATGPILIQAITDRFDNNVDNGIADAVYNVALVPVIANNPYDPLIVASSTIADAYVGGIYAGGVSVSGGTAPYYWTLAPGSSLPPGLVLGSDGAIFGTPTKAGTYSFNLVVSDSALSPASVVTVPVQLSVVSALSIVTTSLPSGTSGTAYGGAVLEANGGRPPYAWTAVGLPSGLTLDGRTGLISGSVPTVTAATTTTAVVTVTDANSKTASKALTITVNPPPAVTP